MAIIRLCPSAIHPQPTGMSTWRNGSHLHVAHFRHTLVNNKTCPWREEQINSVIFEVCPKTHDSSQTTTRIMRIIIRLTGGHFYLSRFIRPCRRLRWLVTICLHFILRDTFKWEIAIVQLIFSKCAFFFPFFLEGFLHLYIFPILMSVLAQPKTEVGRGVNLYSLIFLLEWWRRVITGSFE